MSDPSSIYRQKLLTLADANVLDDFDQQENVRPPTAARLEDALVALDTAISTIRVQVGDVAARDLLIAVYDLSATGGSDREWVDRSQRTAGERVAHAGGRRYRRRA